MFPTLPVRHNILLPFLMFAASTGVFVSNPNLTCGTPAPTSRHGIPQETDDTVQLRFSFHQQPWEDVLNWFARQADLSLVVDQLPPGDFTFSDTKTYSPKESIDLLNSVLLTKDFTLVRKDKMLIVLKTSEGVPYDLIPQETVDGLKDRGRFELVTVTFPLEGRPLETVQTEIQPLIGPLGRMFPMPATGKIQVTETAGKMTAIGALIQSIPKPQPPKKPEPKPAPPAQVLKPYAVADLDLSPTADLLSKAVGGIRATADEKTNQIFIYATDEQHAAIETVLATLRANPQPDQVQVQTYPYRSADATSLVAQLKAIDAAASIQVDPVLKRLIIVAPGTQQTLLQQALEKIEGPMDSPLQLRAYTIPAAEQTQWITTLGELVPGAKITAQAEQEKILVIADQAQQQQIEQVLQQVQQEGLMESAHVKQLESFPLKHRQPAEVMTLLATMHPRITLQADPDNQQLLGVLSASQAEEIRQSLSKLDVAPDAMREPQLQLYDLTDQGYQQLSALLPQLAPDAKATWDARQQKLVVVADEKGQQQIQKLLDSAQSLMQEQTPAIIRVHDVTPQQKTRLTTVLPTLKTQFPNLQILTEADPRRLTVWAPESEQEQLVSLLQNLQTTMEQSQRPSLQTFAVTPEQKTRFTTLLPTLKEQLPDVQILPDTDPRRLTLWAPEDQKKEAQSLLESLLVQDNPQTKLVLGVYPIRSADPATVHSTLVKLFPGLDIILETETDRIVAYATAAQQEEIRSAVEQLDIGDSANSRKSSIQVYPLKNLQATVARQAVLTLVPKLTLTIDTTNNSLIAWGPQRDHKELGLLLQQMEATADSGQRTMQVYDTFDQDALELSRLVQQLAPTAVVSANRGSRGIAVWATDEQHQAIAPAIQQLQDLSNKDQRELETFTTIHTGAAVASRLLRGVSPDAAFFPSKDDRSLFAYADPDQLPRIRSVMEQLENRNANETADRIQAYSYRQAVLTAARPLIAARVPTAQWVETGADDQWLIWASEEDQQIIGQVLQNMDQSLTQDTQQTLQIYVLDKINATDAQTTITSIVGSVTYLASPNTDQLRVWATAAQHEKIAGLLQQLQAQVADANESRPLEIYAIDPDTTVATVFQSLDAELLAGMSVIQNPERNALIVRASPEKHAQLKQEIDQFLAALPEKLQRTPKVYPLKHVTPLAAQQLLVTLVPTATYAIDPIQGNLAATALPEDHQQIQAAIQQIDVPSDQPLQTLAYRVPTGFAAAIQTSLLPMYPKARISIDSTASTLVVAATEKEHGEISKIIDDVILASNRGLTSQVYMLKVASPLSVMTVLRQVFPQSQSTADAESGSLVVTATEQQHERISQLIEQLDIANKDREAKVYRLRNASPQAAQTALAQALPRASITVDRSSGSLIATASPEDHQQIQQTIQQLENSDDSDLETVSYTLTGADPRSAQVALESLIPSAQFAADSRAGVLIATASKEQQKRIQSVVDQMENSDTNKPHARAIEIEGGNSERLYSMLSRMYRFDSEVRFTYETTSGTIMFIGPKRQEEAVMELVDQWNAVVKQEQPRDVKVYELMEVDGDAIVESLDELFEEQAPKPDLQVQWYTNKLIAVATPEQHVVIENTIQQIRGQQRQLEVFTLVVNSPETVEDAIDQMFIDLPVGGSPSVTASVETQQIFVRATPTQLEEVRALLIKLGEPEEVVQTGNDPNSPQGTGMTSGRPQLPGGRVRVLSAEQNAEALLKRLEKVWPQVSPVPLKIMRPQDSDPPADLPKSRPPESDQPKSQNAPTTPIRTSVPAAQDSPSTDDPPAVPAGDAILVVPGKNQLTIASEDQEALSLFQELFHLLRQQEAGEARTEITGNFTVFQLENAGAADVASSVTQLFQQISASQSRDRRSSQPRSRVSVVPDERLNALIVYGPPNDRRTIDQLIKVLDTSELPNAANRLNQARIVQVENVEADQIMNVLQSVYRTQLRPDQPPRIQIPAGVSVEVAVALREMNAAATAPLLTLEVDQATNSIIVLASERLGTEVENLINRLDQQNKDGNTRSIKVIALENSSTERIQEAIERLLRNSRRRDR